MFIRPQNGGVGCDPGPCGTRSLVGGKGKSKRAPTNVGVAEISNTSTAKNEWVVSRCHPDELLPTALSPRLVWFCLPGELGGKDFSKQPLGWRTKAQFTPDNGTLKTSSASSAINRKTPKAFQASSPPKKKEQANTNLKPPEDVASTGVGQFVAAAKSQPGLPGAACSSLVVAAVFSFHSTCGRQPPPPKKRPKASCVSGAGTLGAKAKRTPENRPCSVGSECPIF